MIELENLTFSQYVDLTEVERTEYDFAIKYAFKFTRPVNEYKMDDIFEYKFGVIKDFQYELENGINTGRLAEYICIFAKLDTLASEPLDKVMRFKSYLMQELEALVNAERSRLSGEENEHANGLFEGLGIYLQFRALHKGDVTKQQEIYNLPYHLCFAELVTQAELATFNKRIAEASRKK